MILDLHQYHVKSRYGIVKVNTTDLSTLLVSAEEFWFQAISQEQILDSGPGFRAVAPNMPKMAQNTKIVTHPTVFRARKLIS